MSQIRIANKQDEPQIRALMKDALLSIGKAIDLEGSDADLKNIEWNYFGHDGVFVVFERNGEIAGIAGATKLSDDAIEVKRLFVRPDLGLDNAHADLLDMLFDFASKMDYRVVECAPSAAQFAPAGLLASRKFQNRDGRLFINIWGA